MKEISIQDLHEGAVEPAMELDEEDLEDLLSEAYYLLHQYVELRQSKRLQNDGLRLIKRLEEAICWHKLM